ncbi:hypothetical protein K445DRAFT_376589 [Daldinia sp. EC12]|nr:hypothetical protein K445DRAFT_376589 [Daldinia sp. EC12]
MGLSDLAGRRRRRRADHRRRLHRLLRRHVLFQRRVPAQRQEDPAPTVILQPVPVPVPVPAPEQERGYRPACPPREQHPVRCRPPPARQCHPPRRGGRC